jgi:hypothetical protein
MVVATWRSIPLQTGAGSPRSQRAKCKQRIRPKPSGNRPEAFYRSVWRHALSAWGAGRHTIGIHQLRFRATVCFAFQHAVIPFWYGLL